MGIRKHRVSLLPKKGSLTSRRVGIWENQMEIKFRDMSEYIKGVLSLRASVQEDEERVVKVG